MFYSLNSNNCERNAEPMMFKSTSKDVEIPFTYSVQFKEISDISFEYITAQFSLFNPYFIFLVLSSVVGSILLILLYINVVQFTTTTDDISKTM